ncbi:MAG: hypothetical protein OXE95_07450, partial [Chloroflexi bacterium]|nr:hypothetical protein [Chloroflexota bacterium]
ATKITIARQLARVNFIDAWRDGPVIIQIYRPIWSALAEHIVLLISIARHQQPFQSEGMKVAREVGKEGAFIRGVAVAIYDLAAKMMSIALQSGLNILKTRVEFIILTFLRIF